MPKAVVPPSNCSKRCLQVAAPSARLGLRTFAATISLKSPSCAARFRTFSRGSSVLHDWKCVFVSVSLVLCAECSQRRALKLLQRQQRLCESVLKQRQ